MPLLLSRMLVSCFIKISFTITGKTCHINKVKPLINSTNLKLSKLVKRDKERSVGQRYEDALKRHICGAQSLDFITHLEVSGQKLDVDLAMKN